MIKDLKKYDKRTQRTFVIETKEFNDLLTSANAAVKVVPRDIEVRKTYEAYVQNCRSVGEPPIPEYEYEEKFISLSCSFETCENVPANVLLRKALDVKSVEVRYAKDRYGKFTNNELEVTYTVA